MVAFTLCALVLFFSSHIVADQPKQVPSFIELPDTDYNFPVLGFGTAAMGGKGFESVVAALEAGIQVLNVWSCYKLS